MEEYDYVIIGGGPCGLTTAFYLSQQKKEKILIIDSNENLGGCHRVKRVGQLFTEHGPRIYSTAYVNFRSLLKDMELRGDSSLLRDSNSLLTFENLFTDYEFKFVSFRRTLKTLSIREVILFFIEYIKLVFNNNNGKYKSVEHFLLENNFSEKSFDFIDRICRMTDGAAANRTSLNQFLQILNQHFFYNINQPTNPNDIQLFKLWEDRLISNNVTIWKNTFVNQINKVDSYPLGEGSLAKSIVVTKDGENTEISAKKFIFAIPPKSFYSIINNSSLTPYYPGLSVFSEETNYNIDIPITFHWDKKIYLPKEWGLSSTDWGLTFIVLSNYFKDYKDKTLISVCITRVDSKSSFTGKSPNETISRTELLNETFRQLKESLPSITPPDFSILNPSIIRDNNKWIEKDTAFVTTYKQEFYPYDNKDINNLYFIGTHNGNSNYHFTALESAVQNALHFLIGTRSLLKSQSIDIKIKKRIDLIPVLRLVLLLIICFSYFYFYKKRKI